MNHQVKLLLITLAHVVIFAAYSAATSAQNVSLSETQTISERGEDLLFVFTAAPIASDSPGQLVIHASGDFVHSIALSDESLTWNIDNLVEGGPVGSFVSPISSNEITSSVGGPFDFVVYTGGNGSIEFQRTFDLTAAEIRDITIDGVINITADLGSSVDGGQFVGVTLSYQAVPEPSLMSPLIFVGTVLTVSRRRAA